MWQKTIKMAGLIGFGLETGALSRRATTDYTVSRVWPQNHQVSQFGLKPRADSVRPRIEWRACGAITRLASMRSKGEETACPSDALRKSWTVFPRRGVFELCTFHVRVS